MPVPSNWSQTAQSERLTSQGWEISQTWKGMAGTSGSTIAALLSALPGFSAVRISRPLPSDTGDGEAECEIVYSASEAGTIRPTSDPDYGLIKRTWTRHANAVQDSILNHPKLLPLVLQSVRWTRGIQVAAQKYVADMQTAIEANIAAPTNTEIAPYPDATDYIRAATPSGCTDTDGIADWLFDELVQDSGASYDFDQYVLRKSEVVISSTVLRASDTNVGRVLSYSTLTTSEPTLPAAALLASAGLTTWYWLKKAPEIEAVSGGNFQIVQEYWGFPVLTQIMTMRYGDPL